MLAWLASTDKCVSLANGLGYTSNRSARSVDGIVPGKTCIIHVEVQVSAHRLTLC